MFENRVAFAAVIATVALMGCGSTEAGVTAGTGGTDGSGGASGTGGSTGDGGASGTGGSAGIGGTAGESGTSGMGGSAGIGGAAGEGGASGAGGTAGIGGGAAGAGGNAATGGAGGEGGASGAGGTAATGGTGGIEPACTTAEDCDDQDLCTADRCDTEMGCVHDEIIRVVCSRDADGDGYGWRTDVVAVCKCPPGYILPRSDAKFDCLDANADVNPGHSSYETTGFCSTGVCQAEFVSYNWDCSSSGEDMQYPNMSDGLCRFVGSGGFAVCRGTGWIHNVPDCGDSGAYRSCDSFDGCSEKLVPPRTQACR